MPGIDILKLEMLMLLPLKSCKYSGAWKVIRLQAARGIML